MVGDVLTRTSEASEFEISGVAPELTGTRAFDLFGRVTFGSGTAQGSI